MIELLLDFDTASPRSVHLAHLKRDIKESREELVDVKSMSDFSRAKVYQLVNNVDDEVYVGSTCLTLSKRLAAHKSEAKKGPTRRVYAHVVATGGWANWQIVLVEDVPCANQHELWAHERRHIEVMGTLNKNIPGRAKSEWYAENRDNLAEKRREYYVANRDEIAEYQRAYAAEHQDKIAEYQREYYAENRDEIAEYHRVRYDKNRDEIAEYHRAHYAENRDKLTEKQRVYYAENRDKVAEYQLAYNAKNRDKIAERRRTYYAENRDAISKKKQAYDVANREEINARRRASYAERKAGAV